MNNGAEQELEGFEVGKVVQGRDIIDTYVLLTLTEKELKSAIESIRDQSFSPIDAEKDTRVSVKLLLAAYKANDAKLVRIRKLSLEVLSF